MMKKTLKWKFECVFAVLFAAMRVFQKKKEREGQSDTDSEPVDLSHLIMIHTIKFSINYPFHWASVFIYTMAHNRTVPLDLTNFR